MDKIKILSHIYIVLGILFIVSLTVHPYPGSYILKSLPILIFAYLSYQYLEGNIKYLMTAAFIFSAAGDVLLDLGRAKFFVPALVSFLIAHVLYAIVFLNYFRFKKQRLIIVGALVVYVSIIFYLSELGNLFVPVLIYILVITVMGIIASFSDRPLNGVLLGALLFILSDSIIAINKFIYTFPYSTYFNISIYYLAQYKIGMGMLQTKKMDI